MTAPPPVTIPAIGGERQLACEADYLTRVSDLIQVDRAERRTASGLRSDLNSTTFCTTELPIPAQATGSSHSKCGHVTSSQRPAPPSPASTKVAHASGWANSGELCGSSIAIIARLSASARPIDGSLANSAKVPVVSLTVAPDHARQCETKSERAPA